jgi:hypothetical protein
MVEMLSDGFDDGRDDGANDGSSVGGMVAMWSEGFDDGKADGTLLGFTLGFLEGKAEDNMLTSVEGVELGCCDCAPLRTPSSSSKLGAFVEDKLVLVGANDGSSVGDMVETWSEGFDDGKADGASDGLKVPFRDTETVGAEVGLMGVSKADAVTQTQGINSPPAYTIASEQTVASDTRFTPLRHVLLFRKESKFTDPSAGSWQEDASSIKATTLPTSSAC